MANGYLCYHHNDMDGKAAGFEVYNYLMNQGVKPNANMFIMRGYDEPYNENDFANKTVFIVDLSFTLSSIQKLFTICEGAAEVFWIDHHKSSIECIENDDIRSKLDNYKNLTYFVNNNACGALLSYYFFNSGERKFPSNESIDYNFTWIKTGTLKVDDPHLGTTYLDMIPKYLRLVDQWDRWTYGNDPEPVWFNYGCSTHNTSLFCYETKDSQNKTFNVRFWGYVPQSYFLNNVLHEGKIAKRYADSRARSARSAGTYECNIAGYRALVLNFDGNSQVFGSRIKDYDLVCLWQYNGKFGLYTYSLYTDKDNVDCAKLATKFNPNGGGHQKAAGFSHKELIFKPKF